MRKKIFSVFVFAALLAGCAGSNRLADGGALAEQMVERLAVMGDVAAFKFRNDLPVEDREREETLLRSLEADGEKLGVPQEVTRSFFRRQIEAAKVVQQERIDAWTSGESEPPAEIPDLAEEIRPQLDRLSRDMLLSLNDLWSQSQNDPARTEDFRESAADSLQRAGFSEATISAAVGSWKK